MRTGLIQLCAISRIRCAPSGWGPKGSERKCFEVLHNGGEMKLVARAGKSPEPQPLEAVVCLQVREAHFNTLPFVSRLGKRLCLHPPSCDIAGVLMDIAPWCSTSLVLGTRRSPASRRGTAACVRRSR